MFNLLSILATILTGVGVEVIKEKTTPVIPTENWANTELYNQDILNGVSHEQRMNNLQNGKYKQTVSYPEPHRGEDGKIIVENSLLFNEDMEKYGVVQTYKWVEQGKYNLTPEELEAEHKRIDEKYEELFKLVHKEYKVTRV